MKYLPKYYPAFVKLLTEIAEKGNRYKGSDATPLSIEDSAKIGQIIRSVQSWINENPELLQKAGVRYEREIFVQFGNDVVSGGKTKRTDAEIAAMFSPKKMTI